MRGIPCQRTCWLLRKAAAHGVGFAGRLTVCAHHTCVKEFVGFGASVKIDVLFCVPSRGVVDRC
jgi:hypothetical protein